MVTTTAYSVKGRHQRVANRSRRKTCSDKSQLCLGARRPQCVVAEKSHNRRGEAVCVGGHITDRLDPIQALCTDRGRNQRHPAVHRLHDLKLDTGTKAERTDGHTGRGIVAAKLLVADEAGYHDALASERLRDGEKKNLLMVVVRNHTTGSAWPLTNNPDAIYNDPTRPDDNRLIPLWQLVRASTAAPVFFPPETAKLGDTTYEFVDGSITPYSNPALIAALTAILPGYRVNWTPGPENIRLVSVGTIAFSSEVPLGDPRVGLGIMATKIPTAVLQTTAALMQSIGWQQDFLCRCLGDCIFAEKLDAQTMSGEKLDTEVGDLLCSNPAGAPPAGRSWFSYVRYNRTFRKKEMLKILENDPRLKRIDAIDAIPRLSEIGKEYAEANVKLEHLV